MTALKRFSAIASALALSAFVAAPAMADLPDPDGQEADMSKPVQVFIIMGQSNTLEMGKVGSPEFKQAIESGKYPYLVDDEGNWTKRKDVRNVSVMMKRGNANIYRDAWLAVNDRKIGIEIGIGSYLGEAIDAPVMILKSSIGNRSLGWDLLPPGSERYEFEGKDKQGNPVTWVYPGYKDEVRHGQWVKGEVPDPPTHGWYAGKQWDDDIQNAHMILNDLEKHYPGAKSGNYEVAGFLWWQGDKDFRNPGHAARYEKNLGTLYEALKKEFNAPDAPMVIATLGQTEKGADGTLGQIIDAMMNFDGDSGKHPENKGKVKTVYTHPVAQGQGSSGHYGGKAEVYMDVGEMMGKAMVELIKE